MNYCFIAVTLSIFRRRVNPEPLPRLRPGSGSGQAQPSQNTPPLPSFVNKRGPASHDEREVALTQRAIADAGSYASM